MITPADWSLPAASFGAPVLGSDQSACPANENYILISRPSCPTNGVHFKVSNLQILNTALAGQMVLERPKYVKARLKGWAGESVFSRIKGHFTR